MITSVPEESELKLTLGIHYKFVATFLYVYDSLISTWFYVLTRTGIKIQDYLEISS